MPGPDSSFKDQEAKKKLLTASAFSETVSFTRRRLHLFLNYPLEHSVLKYAV